MKLPFKIESLEQRRARVRLRAPLIGEPVPEPKQPPEGGTQSEGEPPAGRRSFSPGEPDFTSVADILPQSGDFIYPRFRALSARVLEGYWLDFTREGVLEASAAMLAGQTVYPDHHFWEIDKHLGVVRGSSWDPDGAASDGVPGINVELMIDAVMNPRIARGLMMRPPAIHSASTTVLFEFDFSHPELFEQDRFWYLLGEEVDGSIVRLIVTKIMGYWELSLVFQGADPGAKQLSAGKPDFEGTDPEELKAAPVETPAPATTTEVNTVKLTKERKEALGLTAHEGEEVPDDQVWTAVDSLAARANAGDTLLQARREECLRQATLATLGGSEGKLNDALVSMINNAPADQVEGLIKLYAEQAAQRVGSGRSSVESSAGQPPETPAKPVVDTNLL